MKVYGFCRFSFFGQSDTGKHVQSVEDAQRLLWNHERMAVRFHLLENMMLPSIRHQDDQDFSFVILTSHDMPDTYQARLDAAVADMPNVRILRAETRNIGYALKPIMREASNDQRDPAVHFRIDDDDAVAVQYVSRLRAAAQGLRPDTMISFSNGVLGFTDGDIARHRAFDKTAIAIGLAIVKHPDNLRNVFQIQHRAYMRSNPHYIDPTFPAYHYTRHSTNNTNGYDQTVHRSGGVVDIIARNSYAAHPEFAEGAVTTDAAEAAIASAFPWTDGPRLRQVIAQTQHPDRLRQD